MAGNFNKIILMGNLTRDPQLTYLPSNTPVVEIGLAVNRRFKKQDGTQGEETLFIDCKSMGRTAEVINQYCRKGQPLFIEGRLQLDSWQDKEGNRRSKHRVFIENFQFVDSPANRSGGGPSQGAPDGGEMGGYGGDEAPESGYGARPPASRPAGRGPAAAGGYGASRGGDTPPANPGGDPMDADDIPF